MKQYINREIASYFYDATPLLTCPPRGIMLHSLDHVMQLVGLHFKIRM
nr:MAG TPA: hypothetical protein [Caudoviricetes sp.]